MTNQEFIEATGRIERYYEKSYTDEQLKEMYEAVKSWDINKYAKAVTACIQNCKYMPKIIDILNNEPFEKKENIQQFEFVKCNVCNGEGFIKYFQKVRNGDSFINYEYIALCDCENGKNQRRYNNYNFPFASQLNLVRRNVNE